VGECPVKPRPSHPSVAESFRPATRPRAPSQGRRPCSTLWHTYCCPGSLKVGFGGEGVKRGIGLFGAAVFGLFVPMFAHATLTVTPITWNVVGLDSNNPTSGPRFFPAGARVCSNVATTNVAVNWIWDSANANVNLRSGSLSTI